MGLPPLGIIRKGVRKLIIAQRKLSIPRARGFPSNYDPKRFAPENWRPKTDG
jgi:hypothetical protein